MRSYEELLVALQPFLGVIGPLPESALEPYERYVEMQAKVQRNAHALHRGHGSACLCAECWAEKEVDWNARDAGWFKRPEVAGPPALQVVSRRSPELQLPREAARRDGGKIGNRPRCRVCGCTDDDFMGCIERTGDACSWVEADLCSACVFLPGGRRS